MKNPFKSVRFGKSYNKKLVSKVSEFFYTFAKLFRYAKISVRLMIFFALLSSVPLIILGLFSYNKSSLAIESKIESYSSEIMAQTAQNIKVSMEHIEAGFGELQTDQTLMDYLKQYDQGSSLDYQANDILHKILLAKFSPATIEGCSGALILSKGSSVASTAPYQVEKDFTGKEKEYADIAGNANGRFVWMLEKSESSSENYLLVLKQIYNEASGYPLGIIMVILDDSYISNMLSQVNIEGSSDFFIIDSGGTIISSKNTEKLPVNAKYSSKQVINGISNEIKKVKASPDSKDVNTGVVKSTFKAPINGKSYMVCFSQVYDSGWNIVSTIPMSYLNSDSENIMYTMLSVSVVIFILAVLISLFISASISSPLNKLRILMKEARDGNLNISLKDRYNDEISILSENFDEMVGNIRELVLKVSGSSQNVLQSAEKVNSLSSVFHTTAEQVAEGMQQIAQGTAEQAEENSKTLEFVNILSDDINKVGNEVKAASEIIYSTRSLSENALNAVKTLNEKSVQTSRVTDDIVNNIHELNIDMKEIQKIIKFIGSISEQTNMLSLNAAIEAARAGEAGKGFAVVAEQVRKLADQTKEALTTISNVIKNIEKKAQLTAASASNTQEIITQQMSAVNQTDKSFKAICDSLGNISKYMESFEASVTNILQSGQKTLEAINNISSVSEETAATAQEITATAQHQIAGVDEVAGQSRLLNELAQELDNSISIFKV